MFKFLLTPKWIALTLAVIVLIPTFKALSDWQWNRFNNRQNLNNSVIDSQQKPSVPFIELAPTGELISTTDQWRSVTATGQFIANEQYLIRKKSLDSDPGLWVVTPFRLDTGQVITVVRGWTAAAASAQLSPDLTPLPNTKFELSGRLRQITLPIKAEPNDLPPGQRVGIDPKYGTAYLELVSANPALQTPEILTLPGPKLSEGTHRSYAIQWIIFIVMLVGGYGVLIRNELVNRRKLTTM